MRVEIKKGMFFRTDVDLYLMVHGENVIHVKKGSTFEILFNGEFQILTSIPEKYSDGSDIPEGALRCEGCFFFDKEFGDCIRWKAVDFRNLIAWRYLNPIAAKKDFKRKSGKLLLGQLWMTKDEEKKDGTITEKTTYEKAKLLIAKCLVKTGTECLASAERYVRDLGMERAMNTAVHNLWRQNSPEDAEIRELRRQVNRFYFNGTFIPDNEL